MAKTKENTKRLRGKALLHIWGWATMMSYGIENGELSDFFEEETIDSGMSEEDCLECMKWMQHEADILQRKKQRLELKS